MAAHLDHGAHERHALGFLGDNGCQSATVTLTRHDDRLALAGALRCQATVLPIGLLILLLGVSAEIGAIDLDHAGQGADVLNRAEGFPHLVGKDEGRLVLNVEIAAELQGGDTLDRVDEDRRGGEQIADRQLAGGEDSAGRDAELMAASLALPDAAGGIGVNRRALATRAECRAAVVAEPDRHESVMRLIVRHPEDRLQGKRPGLC